MLLGSPRISRWEKAKKIITWLSKVSEECLDPEVLSQSDDPGIVAVLGKRSAVVAVAEPGRPLSLAAIAAE
ncbi:MAG: hypothetical protein AAFU55_14950, partial [Pseudomonadota bacterium]